MEEKKEEGKIKMIEIIEVANDDGRDEQEGLSKMLKAKAPQVLDTIELVDSECNE